MKPGGLSARQQSTGYCGYAYGCEPIVVPPELVLRHGRQPRQLPGQPLLGLREAREDQGKAFLIYWSWDAETHWLRWWRLGHVHPLVPRLAKRVASAEPALEASLAGQRRASGLGIRRLRCVRGESARSDATPRARAPPSLSDSSAKRPDVLGPRRAYVHVPFCAQRCGYCSFNTAPYEAGAMDRYLAARAARDRPRGGHAVGVRAVPALVFFGGGTPSLARRDEMAAVLETAPRALRDRARCRDHRRVQPESVSRATARGLPAGRRQPDQPRRADPRRSRPAAARPPPLARGGPAGIRGRAGGGLRQRQRRPHLRAARSRRRRSGSGRFATCSTGSRSTSRPTRLTLDEGSLWHATGVAGLPPRTRSRASTGPWPASPATRGYEHYEISNYARPGRRSRPQPDLLARRGVPRVRPGRLRASSATSRYANVKPVERYCALVERGAAPLDTHERADRRASGCAERLILGLRLVGRHPDRLARRANPRSSRPRSPRSSTRGGRRGSSLEDGRPRAPHRGAASSCPTRSSSSCCSTLGAAS